MSPWPVVLERLWFVAPVLLANMNANGRSLGQIFDPSIRLVVPLFQRPYVWEQKQNWKPLWDSIRDVAERRLAGKLHRPHFLGAVVLDRLNTPTCAIDARQVIDGQQRMTTFQIALAAARDLCGSLGDTRFCEAFRKLTRNDSLVSDERDDVFKVWPTNPDRSAFRNVMTADSCEEVCKRFHGTPNAKHVGPHNRIANAYLFFYRRLADWLGEKDGENFGKRLRALWQTIKDDMQVVVIDLDEKDDAQVIFETLNALGTPLLPADLIKNFLFQAAEAQSEDSDQLYEKYWKPFDDDEQQQVFWRAVVGQGRLKRPRIDQFLQHYLTLLKGNEVPASHLFEEFRDYAGKNPTLSAADHLRSLHTYGGVFAKFQTGYDESSREGQFFYRLEELETTTFFPLLLEVFKLADQHSSQETRTVLTDLESFVIRRMVCGLTTKGYNTLVRSLIQKLLVSGSFSSAAIRDFLLRQDSESTRWPTDEQFQDAFVSRPVYTLLTRSRVRIVLEAMELALHSGKSEKIKVETNLTIEHVMPQEWAGHWPLPKNTLPEEAKQRRNRLIHTFGNLTLVTSKLNPSMSNSSWETKKKMLSEHGAFTLNRRLCGLDAWDDSAIEHRARELFTVAKALWPKPVAPSVPESASESLDLRNIQGLPDLIAHSDHFTALRKQDRKAISRITSSAAQLLRNRTGEGEHAFASITVADSMDLIARHPKLLKAVKHIWNENGGNENRIRKYLSLGYSSGLLYMMGSARSDATKYRAAPTCSEILLDWSLWDKACEFWRLLGDVSRNELEPARETIRITTASPVNNVVASTQERLAIIVKAWGLYVQGHKITAENLKLHYHDDEDSRYLAECPIVGGIDLGDPKENGDTDTEDEADPMTDSKPEELEQ